jgi:hypothetical protein
MTRKWWKILGFCVVVLLIVAGLVVGSIFLVDYFNPKQVVAKQEPAVNVGTTATTEAAVTEESITAETVAVETTEGSPVKDVKVYPYIVEQEGGVPDNGNSLTISVGTNDLGYASMGPVELFGMKFSGGQDSEGKDIGNIVILLGTTEQKTNYTLNSVDNGNVYYKVVRYKTAPVQADIDKLINQGVIDFNKEGNGTSGDGVDKGYIVIANPESILKTIYFEVENGVIQIMQEVKL